MDRDVAPPSTVIGGVPQQFDDLVLRATARIPAAGMPTPTRWRRTRAIVDELGLPDFRVPAPRNSAQHLSAQVHRSRVTSNATTVGTASRRRRAGTPES
jgi:serine/threonine-protein kinase